MLMEERIAIEQLLYLEAHLLDEHRFEGWLNLLTDDIEYLMPLTEHVQGKVPAAGHPIIEDDRAPLGARVAKHNAGFSHVEIPVSMTRRTIGNVLVEEEVDGEVTVKSTVIVRQARKLRDRAWWWDAETTGCATKGGASAGVRSTPTQRFCPVGSRSSSDRRTLSILTHCSSHPTPSTQGETKRE